MGAQKRMGWSVNGTSCAGSGLVLVLDLVAFFAQGIHQAFALVGGLYHPTPPIRGIGKPVVDFGNSGQAGVTHGCLLP
jgi:hypothetical protein